MGRHSLILAVSFLASKLLGLLRETLLAHQFGTGQPGTLWNLDAYNAAFRIPDFLFNVLSYGALSAAFIPLFVEIVNKKNKEEAFKFSNEVLNGIGLIIIGISCFAWIGAPLLMKAVVPGFLPEDQMLTANLTRIMMLTPLFFTIGNVLSGINNSFDRFWGIALSPILYNAGIIAGIIFYGPTHGVYGIAAGVVAGAGASLLIQLPEALKSGFRYRLVTKLWTQKTAELLRLAIPRIFGISVSQISLLTATIISSTIMAGSLSTLTYAINLQFIPIGIIGISTAVASFRTLSDLAAKNETISFANHMRQAISRICMYTLPMIIGLYMLRFEVVHILFEHGRFSQMDVIQTAQTLAILLIGTLFDSLIFILARGFYARKNTRTPVIIGCCAVAVHIAMSIVTTRILGWGIYGLALGSSVSAFLNCTLLYLFLSRALQQKLLNYTSFGYTLIASLVLIGSVVGGKALLPANLNIVIATISLSLLGAAAYMGTHLLLGKIHRHM